MHINSTIYCVRNLRRGQDIGDTGVNDRTGKNGPSFRSANVHKPRLPINPYSDIPHVRFPKQAPCGIADSRVVMNKTVVLNQVWWMTAYSKKRRYPT